MNTLRIFTAGAILIALFPLSSAAQTRVVRFGKLWDGTKVITNAVVTIKEGRVVTVAVVTLPCQRTARSSICANIRGCRA